jgi:hypothetical protein
VSAYLQRAATPGRVLDVEFDADPGATAAVRRVTVRDAATGQVLATLERGRPFTIELAFEVRETIPDLSVDLFLVDELGVVIVYDSVRDRPFAGALSDEPGTYVLAATIPPLLRPGRYTVRCWIGNEYDDTVERDLLTIRIAPRADDPQHFIERTRAVQPEIEWKVWQDPLP